jgi:hypothetical protein
MRIKTGACISMWQAAPIFCQESVILHPDTPQNIVLAGKTVGFFMSSRSIISLVVKAYWKQKPGNIQ